MAERKQSPSGPAAATSPTCVSNLSGADERQAVEGLGSVSALVGGRHLTPSGRRPQRVETAPSAQLLLDRGGRKGRFVRQISCRKSETRLNLPDEQSLRSRMAQDCGLPLRRLSTPRKRAEKETSRPKLRNPLRSLDSGERIEGNPSESKARGGASQRNGHETRKTDRLTSRVAGTPQSELRSRFGGGLTT